MSKNCRVNEEKLNNQGSLMKIIEYKNPQNIIVEFQDKNKYTKKASITNWNYGNIKNPYFKNVYGVGCIGTDIKNIVKDNKYFYDIWHNMIKRCYYEKDRKNSNSYINCSVCEEWLSFYNFLNWCKINYYKVNDIKMQLDKDILFKNNKIYSPQTCCFVPSDINKMFVGLNNDICGVSYDKSRHKWTTSCNVNGKTKHLGRYDNIFSAVLCYNNFKENLIKEKANKYKDFLPKYIYEKLLNYKIKIFIYLVYEENGCYEDYTKNIIKAFFSKEKAESYKQELEQEENKLQQEYNKCCNCPRCDWKKEFNTFSELKDCLKEYCGRFQYISGDDKFTKINQAFIDSKDWDCICCVNDAGWYDDTWYKIEEIEVEE